MRVGYHLLPRVVVLIFLIVTVLLRHMLTGQHSTGDGMGLVMGVIGLLVMTSLVYRIWLGVDWCRGIACPWPYWLEIRWILGGGWLVMVGCRGTWSLGGGYLPCV